MRELKDSDLFKNEINKGNAIFSKINSILSNAETGTVILNDILFDDIKKKIIDNRREKIVSEMGNAILNYRMVLFTSDPARKLSDAIPFYVYKQDGRRMVAVNLAGIVRPIKLPDGSISYDIGDANKVYSMIYGAYLALDRFTANTEISPGSLYDAAVLWAAMFTKPLYDSLGMTNVDRNEAFMYYSMKFFLGYIMGCREEQINSIAGKFINNNKNNLILYMEEKIADKGINIYEGLLPFMRTLFNNEITKLSGIRVSNISGSINVSYYISKFTTVYSSNALLALCTFPYFIYVLIAAVGKSKMVKDKSFDRVFSAYNRELNRLLLNVSRE